MFFVAFVVVCVVSVKWKICGELSVVSCVVYKFDLFYEVFCKCNDLHRFVFYSIVIYGRMV